MSNPKTRKSCAVPKCTNTTTNSPAKLFFLIPMDVKIRKKWIKAMRRMYPFSDKSKVYCCEDHFDIEKDMENYIRYKLVGGIIKLKKGILPHKFECQKEAKDKPERSAVQKRLEIENIAKLLSKEASTSMVDGTEKPEEVVIKEEPLQYEIEIEINDPLSFENHDQSQKILKKHKGVQVALKTKGVHKSTMTDKKYFKKEKKSGICTKCGR